LRRRVVVAARLDFAQTGQNLDALAESVGQRRCRLLGADHVRGVDGIELVAGELVRKLYGLAFTLLAQTRSGDVGVDDLLGVALRLGVPDEGQRDAAYLRRPRAGADGDD